MNKFFSVEAHGQNLLLQVAGLSRESAWQVVQQWKLQPVHTIKVLAGPRRGYGGTVVWSMTVG